MLHSWAPRQESVSGRLHSCRFCVSFFRKEDVFSFDWVNIDGVWIDYRIHLLQNLTTNNYSSLAELLIPKFSLVTEHSVFSVFISRWLVAAANCGRSPPSRFRNCSRSLLISLSLHYTETISSIIAHFLLAAKTSIELCKIWGFHGGDYEEWCLLGCYAVWLL
jgi:hypothetical protein